MVVFLSELSCYHLHCYTKQYYAGIDVSCNVQYLNCVERMKYIASTEKGQESVIEPSKTLENGFDLSSKVTNEVSLATLGVQGKKFRNLLYN